MNELKIAKYTIPLLSKLDVGKSVKFGKLHHRILKYLLSSFINM